MTTVAMNSMSLQALVIVLYLGLLAILGTLGWAASRSSVGEYYLAGRRQGWVVTSLTISATFFSSMAVLGVPGMNFEHGYGIVGGSLCLMLAGVLIWFLMEPFAKNHQIECLRVFGYIFGIFIIILLYKRIIFK